MDDKALKTGFTTGTTAAAAAKASAVRKLTGKVPKQIKVCLPNGEMAILKIYEDDMGVYSVKYSGDDPDVTDGMKIYAEISFNDSGKISITGGEGIGTVTKKGLQIPVGESAINPVPREMIAENIKDIIENRGAVVNIFAPDGERIAKETFNERLGIVGGISIIGTTGIVNPMSKDALIDTIKCEIDVLKAENVSFFYLAPGKIGEKALKNLVGDVKCVQMSNFAGISLEYALECGFSKIGIAGHPGKLAKIPMGYYDTHSKYSPMATDYVKDILGLKGSYNTVEEICSEKTDMTKVSMMIREKIMNDFPFEQVEVLLFDMQGVRVG